MIELNTTQLSQIKEHFTNNHPNEAVCFVLMDGSLLFPENIHINPTESFRVSPDVYAASINTLQAIIHSHPHTDNGIDPRTPSPSDVNNQIKTNVPWGIVSVTSSYISDILWFPCSVDHELFNRPFIHGVYDCYNFVKSYYHQILNITLPSNPMGYNWTSIENSFINDNIKLGEIIEVPLDQAQMHDVITFRKATDNISHFGVYIGPDKIAHHTIGRLSGYERLRKYRPFIYKIYRYVGSNT